jgi:hypothetical protein
MPDPIFKLTVRLRKESDHRTFRSWCASVSVGGTVLNDIADLELVGHGTAIRTRLQPP